MKRIGLNISLGLQAFSEMQPFTEDTIPSRETLDLAGAPVLFHLQTDAELLDYVEKCPEENVDHLDFKKVRLRSDFIFSFGFHRSLCRAALSFPKLVTLRKENVN